VMCSWDGSFSFVLYDALGREFITKEMKEWRNHKETQTRSEEHDNTAYNFCCTTKS